MRSQRTAERARGLVRVRPELQWKETCLKLIIDLMFWLTCKLSWSLLEGQTDRQTPLGGVDDFLLNPHNFVIQSQARLVGLVSRISPAGRHFKITVLAVVWRSLIVIFIFIMTCHHILVDVSSLSRCLGERRRHIPTGAELKREALFLFPFASRPSARAESVSPLGYATLCLLFGSMHGSNYTPDPLLCSLQTHFGVWCEAQTSTCFLHDTEKPFPVLQIQKKNPLCLCSLAENNMRSKPANGKTTTGHLIYVTVIYTNCCPAQNPPQTGGGVLSSHLFPAAGCASGW